MSEKKKMYFSYRVYDEDKIRTFYNIKKSSELALLMTIFVH